jgi:hypothetical protein
MQIDVNVPSSVWKDTARTLPASVGDTIQGVTDRSVNLNHWSQASAGISPALQTGGNGKLVLRFPTTGNTTMNFTAGLSTIRTIYWAIMEAAGQSGAAWSNFFLGDGGAYNFHANDTGHGCFSSTYSTVNLLHIDKANVAIQTARPTTLKVVMAQTGINSIASRFSDDRGAGSRSWQGDIALLLIYSAVHSAGEISSTEDAIKSYLLI